MKLHTIICSTRPGRIGPTVASWFHEVAQTHGQFECELVDLADFALPIFNEPRHPRLGGYEHEHTKKWSASVRSADAFAFVIPEYNYYAPPSLVNAIDYLSAEWTYKAATLVSYGGMSGGLRAAQSAKSLLTTVGIMPIPQGVGIPMVGQMIEDGKLKPAKAIEEGANATLDALAIWAKALKTIRG